MVKSLTMYKCEICNTNFEEYSEAVKCEMKGREEILSNVGDILSYRVETEGGFPDHFEEVRVSKVETKNHYNIYYLEQFDMESGEWEESWHFNSIWGNEEFSRIAKVIKKGGKKIYKFKVNGLEMSTDVVFEIEAETHLEGMVEARKKADEQNLDWDCIEEVK